MVMNHSVEQIIEVSSCLKAAIEAIRAGYSRLSLIIDKEHRGVAASDYNVVNEACEEKALVADEIEEQFRSLNSLSEKVAEIRANVLGQEFERLTNLSLVKNALAEIANSFSQSNFAAQVLKHQADGVAKEADALVKDLSDLKPKIEANRYLVTSILNNMQESYRFWQEVSEQIAISYDKMGQQKAAGRNSGFKIRA